MNLKSSTEMARELVKIAKQLVALDEEGDGGGFQSLIDYENFKQDELERAEKAAERAGKKYILYKKEGRWWRIKAVIWLKSRARAFSLKMSKFMAMRSSMVRRISTAMPRSMAMPK